MQIVGLGVITFACAKVSNPTNNLKKWLCIILVPEVLTLLVYAVTDRTKFEGFPSEIAPLSNMGEGSLGAASFYEIWDAPKRHCFYIVRTVVSIIITISSILLVLIDVVCLEVKAFLVHLPTVDRRLGVSVDHLMVTNSAVELVMWRPCWNTLSRRKMTSDTTTRSRSVLI